MEYATGWMLLGQLITTLLGAFIGAWAAFKLNAHQSEKKTENEQVGAANRALFVLIAQFNTLTNIRQKSIDPIRNDPARFVNMEALLPIDYKQYHLDIQSLGFLLETDFRQLLFELLIEEERFHAAVQALNERSRLHHDLVQPLLEQKGLVAGVAWTVPQVQAALGQRLSISLIKATDGAIEHVDNTFESINATLVRAADQFKLHFPHRKFIRFEVSQPVNSTSPPTNSPPPAGSPSVDTVSTQNQSNPGG